MRKNWNHDRVNRIVAQGADALATNRALLLDLVDSLKAIGWSVVRSCDSVSAGTAGDGVDRWEAAADLVFNAAGNAHSWIVLGYNGYQLLVDLNVASANGYQFTTSMSVSGAFTGGSTTAAPTASDSFNLRGNTTHLASTNGAYVIHVLRAGEDMTLISIWRAGASIAFALIGRWSEYDTNAWSGNYPVVAGWQQGTNAHDSSEWIGVANLHFRFGTDNGDMFMAAEGWLGSDAWGGTLTPNAIDGYYDMFPIGLASETSGVQGRHGWLPDMYIVSVDLDDGDVMTVGGFARFAVLGNLAIPWDDSNPRVDETGAPIPNEAGGRPVSMPNPGGLMVLGNASTQPLAATEDEARWMPIVFDMDVPANHRATVAVRIGTDSGVWLAAYCDADGNTFDGFSPMFDAKSSVVITGDDAVGWRYEFSLLPLGGWHRPEIAVIPMVVREAT